MLVMDHLVLSFVARVISILLFVFCSRSTGGADQPKKLGGAKAKRAVLLQSECQSPRTGHLTADSPRLKCD